MLCKVVDLLVAMAKAAAQSNRRQLIFEPYPSVVDPNDKSRLAFTPDVSLTAFSQVLTQLNFYHIH